MAFMLKCVGFGGFKNGSPTACESAPALSFCQRKQWKIGVNVFLLVMEQTEPSGQALSKG